MYVTTSCPPTGHEGKQGYLFTARLFIMCYCALLQGTCAVKAWFEACNNIVVFKGEIKCNDLFGSYKN